MKIPVLLLFMAALAAGQVHQNDETRDTFSGYISYPENGITYTICADSWDDADARVACRHLDSKYTEGLAYSHYLEPHITGHRFWITEMQCTGYEHDLTYCPHTYITNDDECKSGHHAGMLCFHKGAGIAYRMTGESRASGHVEVNINGDWGSICQDDGWNDNAARVFCRSSGFLDGQVENIPDGTPLHHGSVYSVKLNCSGTESELNRCPHQGWVAIDKSICSHEVAVACFGNVRLHEGEAITGMKTGALEVYHKDQWVSVCDSGFSDLEASVVCRELDPDLPHAKVIKESAFGNLTHVPNITSISCTGAESSIDFCDISDTDTCSSGHYASVACSKTPFDTAEDNATSYNTIDPYSGYIAMYASDSVYTICADGWDDADALVACRFIGYNAGIAYHHYLDSDDFGHIFFASKFECTGHEHVLSECPHQYISKDLQCDSGHHAGVLCWNKGGMTYQMVGSERASGRVEVYINGEWGSMCHDDGWDTQAAQVFCRSSGFHDGRPTSITDDHSGLVWGVYFKCSGAESDLNQCDLKGWLPLDKSACSHDAGVICYGNVQLHNGERNSEMESGAVQIYHQGSWLEVCDTGLSELEAKVVCEEVNPNLPYAQVLEGSAFGTLTHSPVKITSISCTGVESSIANCAISDVGTCPSGHYASVACSKTPFKEEKRELVRLDGGIESKDMQTGSVQVYHHGEWTSVCDSHFTQQEAEVVCQEINQNLPFGMVVKGSVFSPLSKTPINITAIHCTGVEVSLTQCAITDTGSCPSGNYVSVVCSLDSISDREEEAVRLNGGEQSTDVHSGALQIYRNGTWSAVCDAGFTQTAAGVVCSKSFYGFPFAKVVKGSAFGAIGQTPINITSVHCSGTEYSIRRCNITNTGSCPSGQYVSVVCSQTAIEEEAGHVEGLEGRDTDDSAAVPVNTIIIIVVSAIVAGLLVLAVAVVVLYRQKIQIPRRLRQLLRHRRFVDEEVMQASYSAETGVATVSNGPVHIRF